MGYERGRLRLPLGYGVIVIRNAQSEASSKRAMRAIQDLPIYWLSRCYALWVDLIAHSPMLPPLRFRRFQSGQLDCGRHPSPYKALGQHCSPPSSYP